MGAINHPQLVGLLKLDLLFDFRQYTFYITHPKKCILGGVHPLKIYISRS